MSTTTSNKLVPTRPYGSTLNNPRLPSQVPIVGLGCSSFSHFFWNAEQLKENGGLAQWTPDTIDKSHPICQEWIATIQYAIQECGITLLDTAPWYGHGTSEVVIGWALEELWQKGKVERSQLTINTKIGRYEADPKLQFDFSKITTLKSVERSIARMKCQYIDVLQLHDPEFAPTLQQLMEETIPALLECRSKGQCKALGVTGYPLQVQYQILQRSLELTNDASGIVFDQSLTYGHYNLVNTSLTSQPLPDNNQKQSLADYCTDHHIGILAAAPLNMGLFTNNTIPEWHPAQPPLRAACQTALGICQKHRVDFATLAIVFAMANPKIPCTILGMKNKEQVDFAVQLANRFHSVASSSAAPATSSEEILTIVLQDAEYQALQEIRDASNGPFAPLWKDGNYAWDGVLEAKKFWKQVDGVEQEDWHLASE